MVAYGYMNPTQGQATTSAEMLDQFYSVEFSVQNVKFLYQFKIWKLPSNSAFVLVKDNSEILNWIKTGDTLFMKYYSSDPKGSTQEISTRILDITKHYEGRFKGHYVVSLGVNEN